tara:strand:+ start:28 stop:279 length:252 start_codon:yes stop_codon:yes gene_type:complete
MVKKGSKSKTRKGDLDYTTKRGDKDFHEGGKDVKRKRKPYKKRSKAKPKTAGRSKMVALLKRVQKIRKDKGVSLKEAWKLARK